MKVFEAFKKAAAARQGKMKEEFDDKLQSMMEQSKAALKDFQDKTKSFADIIARLESQVQPQRRVQCAPARPSLLHAGFFQHRGSQARPQIGNFRTRAHVKRQVHPLTCRVTLRI
jgi:hypothetical protein